MTIYYFGKQLGQGFSKKWYNIKFVEGDGIWNLDEKMNILFQKATSKINILPRILKESHKVSSNLLQKLVDDAIISGKFPDDLKLTNAAPAFKEKNPLEKINYRPVGVLPATSKIFEKLIEK